MAGIAAITEKERMQDISDEMIARSARGDVEAFEDIVRAYGDLVFNVGLRIVRNRQDAEEVAQEVFLTLHRKLGSFEGRSGLKTWIYRITVNTAINYAKRGAGVKNKTVEYDEDVAPIAQHGLMKEKVEMEYTANVVDKLLGMLSPQQRACIVLRSMEGLSYEDIARNMGIDINAVRSCLKRARDKMLAARKEVMRDGL